MCTTQSKIGAILENQGHDQRRFDASTVRPDRNANANSKNDTTIYALKRRLPRSGILGSWRVMLRRQGQRISRTFKDTAYGSADAAFEQACDYRDLKEEDELPEKRQRQRRIRRSIRHTILNRDGVPTSPQYPNYARFHMTTNDIVSVAYGPDRGHIADHLLDCRHQGWES
ncbi:hypothetical protein [Rhizobium sp. LEGMi135b]